MKRKGSWLRIALAALLAWFACFGQVTLGFADQQAQDRASALPSTSLVDGTVCLTLFDNDLIDANGDVIDVTTFVMAAIGLELTNGEAIDVLSGGCAGLVNTDQADATGTAPVDVQPTDVPATDPSDIETEVPATDIPATDAPATDEPSTTTTTDSASTDEPIFEAEAVTGTLCLQLYNAGHLNSDGSSKYGTYQALRTAAGLAFFLVSTADWQSIQGGGCVGLLVTPAPTATAVVSVDICLSLFNAGLLDLSGNVTVASIPTLIAAVLNAGLTIDLGVLINIFNGACRGNVPAPTATTAPPTATLVATDTTVPTNTTAPTNTPVITVDICLSLFNAGLLDLNGNVTVASLPALILAVTTAGLNIDLSLLAFIFSGGCAGMVPTATTAPSATTGATNTVAPTNTPTVSVDVCLSLFNAGLLDLSGNVTVASLPALLLAVTTAGLNIDISILTLIFSGGCAGMIPPATVGPTGTSAVQTATAAATQTGTAASTSTPTVSVDICLTLFNAGLLDLNGNVTVASLPDLIAAVLTGGLNVDLSVLALVFDGGCAGNVPPATVGPTGTSAVQTATAAATGTSSAPTSTPTVSVDVCLTLFNAGLLDLNGNVTVASLPALISAVLTGGLNVDLSLLAFIFNGGCAGMIPTATVGPTGTSAVQTATAAATQTGTAAPTNTPTVSIDICLSLFNAGLLDLNGNVTVASLPALLVAVTTAGLNIDISILTLIFNGGCAGSIPTATAGPTGTSAVQTATAQATQTLQPTSTPTVSVDICLTLFNAGLLDLNGNVTVANIPALIAAVLNAGLTIDIGVLINVFNGGCAGNVPTATVGPTGTSAGQTATAQATQTIQPTASPTSTPPVVTCFYLTILGILDINGNVTANTPLAIVVAVQGGLLELNPTVLFMIFGGGCVQAEPTPTATGTTAPTSTATSEPTATETATATATATETATATTEPTATATTEPTATATSEPEEVTCATLIGLGILDANGNVTINTPFAIVVAVLNGDLELTPTVLYLIFSGVCVTEPTPTPTATATTEPTSTATTEPTSTATATTEPTATETATATTEPTSTTTAEPTATATSESATVRILVVNSDGSDLPDGLQSCLDGTCQSLQIIAGVGMLALQLPSGSGAYFFNIAPGGHTATAQGANGDVLGTAPVTAVANDTTTVTIVLHHESGANGNTGDKTTPVAVTSLPTTGGGSTDNSSSLMLMLLAAAGSLLLGTLWARRRHR